MSCTEDSQYCIDELNNYVDGIRNKLIAALGDNDEIIVS